MKERAGNSSTRKKGKARHPSPTGPPMVRVDMRSGLTSCTSNIDSINDIQAKAKTLMHQASDVESSSLHDKDFSPSQKRRAFIFRLDWWWETGAMIVSLTSTALVLAILFQMNEKPLLAWKLPIQINSLISVFSSIAKSALLVMLAEGLCQLKWNHLETRGGTLDQLQTFDNASRGPWGAFMFFKMCRTKFGYLAMFGSALTVLGTAFEPFAQQIIEFPSRIVVKRNETAHIRVAEAFGIPLDSSMYRKEGPKQFLAREVMNHLPNLKAQENSHIVCPTSDCEFPEHWSLGACENCQEEVVGSVNLGCNYTWFPNSTSGPTPDLSLHDFKVAVRAGGRHFYQSTFVQCHNIPLLYSEPYTVIHVDADANRSRSTYPHLSVSEPFHVLSWSYNDKPPSDNFTTNMIMSARGATVYSPFPAYQDLDEWQGVEILFGRCDISFCAKRNKNVTVSHRNILKEETSMALTFSRACDSTDCHYSNARTLEKEGPTFRIHMDTRIKFGKALATVAFLVGYGGFTERYLANSTVAEFSSLLSTVVTSFLRSEDNSNSTLVHGSIVAPETYVRVRWQWALFPCSVVLGSALFLALAILESSRKEQLYKSSVLTGYFHRLVGVDGYEVRRLDRQLLEQQGRRDMYYNLEKIAQGVRVRLQRNKEGKLELVREV